MTEKLEDDEYSMKKTEGKQHKVSDDSAQVQKSTNTSNTNYINDQD